MLGVDRLDMIKGIPQKILAFEKFLEENQHWRDKVVLLQIAVPTRTDVPEYQKLTSQVHEIVGRINGRFGSLSAVPIHHLDRSLDFGALCALYAVTVCRCCTVIGCWSNPCQSLEHHRSCCFHKTSFKYVC
nr:alpha,alpha-trehalose-phosphate synthase [UDP-forming] 1 isoform X1 [Ipomoea batatas]GMC74753.1 alpha,alpha-trehalose-phosphate synthase [UDP-forming] 1 isoform X1 [Ipomoea batatas]GME09426.1 alpha,alpha-trehalose-phosphate synthase [UDP-forming] 1 isoform X1 [Ipomoea batatas]GME09432.1 alpha,alpha-trehalose-phosphate synthase [UDP-forming] 1 isoform X1 [Ipomoea batatas]GME13088.1 alpha,alpha-trehalose-phosphate synthase [UDP-forming] 1 isoform X1 [Ipomoea batatas]